MKKSLWIALTTLAVGPIVHPPFSNAAEPAAAATCVSHGVNDAGYRLVVAPNRKSAVLTEESFAGPVDTISMYCEANAPQNTLNGANPSLTCISAIEALEVHLFLGAGYARLFRVSQDGTTRLAQFGQLDCQ